MSWGSQGFTSTASTNRHARQDLRFEGEALLLFPALTNRRHDGLGRRNDSRAVIFTTSIKIPEKLSASPDSPRLNPRRHFVQPFVLRLLGIAGEPLHCILSARQAATLSSATRTHVDPRGLGKASHRGTPPQM